MKAHEIHRFQSSPSQAEVVLYLNPDLFWFRGHFAIQPILPGVAQVEWALNYATEILQLPVRFHSIQQLKFTAPLLPDTTVSLYLEWHEIRQVLTFQYKKQLRDTQFKTSSGKIRLCR